MREMHSGVHLWGKLVPIIYKPPSAPAADLDLLLDTLSNTHPSLLLNLVLLGDFNVNVASESPSLQMLNDISNSFSLNQVVDQLTHFSHSDSSSIIDLVFLPSSLTSFSYDVLPPVSSSNNCSISSPLSAPQLSLFSSTLSSSFCVALQSSQFRVS